MRNGMINIFDCVGGLKVCYVILCNGNVVINEIVWWVKRCGFYYWDVVLFVV